MTFSGIHNLDVLRWEYLTDTVQKFPYGGAHWFKNNLFTRVKKLPNTDTVKWNELTKSRTRAPYAVRGQPAQRLELLTRGVRTASVADIFVSKKLDAADIEYLQSYAGTGEGGDGARVLINDELEDMVEKVQNTVEHACMSVARGSFSVDQTASTTAVKSKGVNFSLTFGVTSMDSGTGGSGPGVWTASTSIYIDEWTRIMNKAQQVYGFDPSRVLISRATMDLLLKNTELKSFMGEEFKTQLITSGWVNNIRGTNLFQYNTGDDDSGSWARYWADAELLFLPPDSKYYEIYEASAMVPSPDRQSLVRVPPGMYSYSNVTVNPVGIELFVGYRFLPINRYPERSILFDRTVST